jgi:Protein of unknown function (DUF1236)
MKILQTATAVALLMGGTAAYAQGQPKSEEGKSAPQAQQSDQGSPKGESQTQQKKATEPKDKMGKGSAQSEPKDKSTKGSQAEPKDKASKGPAQGQNKEQQSGKGTAQTEPKDKASKGSAQTEPRDKGTKGTAQGTDTAPAPKASGSTKSGMPKDSTAGAPSSGQRVQLSEQQRTNVHQAILKDSHVNRVTNANFSINVGTRVPREVRLVVLSASVISIMPAYRSYRYFVVNDQICIVDPNSYQIVEVITVSGQTADRGGSARLVLSDEEKMIILREVDMSGGSTLGLGSLTEGADVPRNVEVREFAGAIVQQVPKVKGYKYFTAQNRIAVVDPQGSKVQLVIEGRR